MKHPPTMAAVKSSVGQPGVESLLQCNVTNFRDLGGLSAGDSRRTRRNRLFRSSTFAFLPKEQLHQIIVAIGPATYYDLRTPAEINRDGDLRTLEEFGWDLERFPIDEFGNDPQVNLQLYDQVAQDILNRKGFIGPLIIACSLGKDRTGQVIARLLHSLGVSKQEILSDYLSSNTHLAREAKMLPERFKPTQNGYETVIPKNIDFDWGDLVPAREALSSFICDESHRRQVSARHQKK